MSEGCHGCPECTAHQTVILEINDQIKDHNELREDFKGHKEKIWEATNSKLSNGMFKWIGGFVILFCMGFGTTQVSLLNQIADLKKDIAVLQILLEKNNATQEEVTSK